MVNLTLRDLRALRTGVTKPEEPHKEPIKAKHRNGRAPKGQRQRSEPPTPLASLRAVREKLRVNR
jgi:hypothetical protein